MFIIKWLRPDNTIYYKYSHYLPLGKDIGYINQFGHEILDINYVYNNKVWSYDDYKNHTCYNKKTKNIILDKAINFLTKLNKQ